MRLVIMRLSDGHLRLTHLLSLWARTDEVIK
jgi:hypothetical protein